MLTHLASLMPIPIPRVTPARPRPAGPLGAAPPSGQRLQAAGEPVVAMARMAVTDPPQGGEPRQPTITRRGAAGKTGGEP